MEREEEFTFDRVCDTSQIELYIKSKLYRVI